MNGWANIHFLDENRMPDLKVGDKLKLNDIPPHIKNMTIGGLPITTDTILEVAKLGSHGDLIIDCDWYGGSIATFTYFTINPATESFLLVSEDEAAAKDSCTCDRFKLMYNGCVCGYLARRRKAGLE